MGGTLDYKELGKTNFHCGGYRDGEPAKFTCAPRFQTEDCAGFQCNWTNVEAPTCDKADPGQFPTEAQCTETCKATTMSKCNLVTKTCEPAKDKTCTKTAGSCADECKHSPDFNVCDTS